MLSSGVRIFAGIFSLGASIELMQSIGIANIEARALELNRRLTSRLSEIGWKVLSPLGDESSALLRHLLQQRTLRRS